MKVLVINCGSSSIKCRLYEMPERTLLAKAKIGRIGREPSTLEYAIGGQTRKQRLSVKDHESGADLLLDTLVQSQESPIKSLREIEAAGHRVVHGGSEMTAPVIVDEDVLTTIKRFSLLAPLHNPADLAGIRAAGKRLPGIAHVACFDTAFHQRIPRAAHIYGLPYEFYEKHGIRKYGFHGLSCRFVLKRAAEMLEKSEAHLSAILCHLGNGCSVTAIKNGQSVDTSMGFTPLEGLVMGGRAGDVDPGVMLFLLARGFKREQLNELFNTGSGLLGLSGVSTDMRDVLEAAAQGNSSRRSLSRPGRAKTGEPERGDRARLAVEVFCYRLRKYIGAYTGVLGVPDALIFTGGIGENAAEVRAKVCENMTHLGIEIDPEKNAVASNKDVEISGKNSKVNVLVIRTNEELEIAEQTFSLVQTA